jgi:hypothetical protein
MSPREMTTFDALFEGIDDELPEAPVNPPASSKTPRYKPETPSSTPPAFSRDDDKTKPYGYRFQVPQAPQQPQNTEEIPEVEMLQRALEAAAADEFNRDLDSFEARRRKATKEQPTLELPRLELPDVTDLIEAVLPIDGDEVTVQDGDNLPIINPDDLIDIPD